MQDDVSFGRTGGHTSIPPPYPSLQFSCPFELLPAFFKKGSQHLSTENVPFQKNPVKSKEQMQDQFFLGWKEEGGGKEARKGGGRLVMSGGEGDRDAEHFAEQLEAFRNEDSVSSGDSDDEGARGSRAGGGKRRGSLGDGVMGGIFATACSVAPDDGDHRCVKISEKTGVGRKADLLLRSATCC